MGRVVLAVLAAVVVILAGCSGGDRSPGAEAEGTTGPTSTIEGLDDGTAGAVRGVVVDDEDSPVAGAVVTVVTSVGNVSATTGPAGAFDLPGVPAGRHMLFVQKLGFDGAALPVTVAAGQTVELTVRLRPLAVDPGFPVEMVLHGLRTQGGWFQIAYSEAAAATPDGFDPRPHVLLEPTGVTAEYHVYVATYESATVAGTTLPGGAWAFTVLSVVPPDDHARGATVEFVPFGSWATDPAFAAILGLWNLPTEVAQTLTMSQSGSGETALQASSTLAAADASFQLATANSQDVATLTGGSITVRVFAVAEGAVRGYVDIDIAEVAYSITGNALLSGAEGLAFSPPAPDGEGYVQWGPSARQTMRMVLP